MTVDGDQRHEVGRDRDDRERRAGSTRRAPGVERPREGSGRRNGDQDDDDRVDERVVVVVRESRHDALERRRRERQRERAPGEDPDEPAETRRLCAARPQEPVGGDRHDDREEDGGQARNVRDEAHQRPASDPEQREGQRRATGPPPMTSPPPVRRYSSTSRSPGSRSGARRRRGAGTGRRRRAARRRCPNTTSRGAAQLEHRQREDRDEEHDAEHVQLGDGARRANRERPPCGRAPPGRSSGGPVALPRGAEREHGEERDRVRVPDERRFVDRRGGDRRAGRRRSARRAVRRSRGRATT